MVKIKYVPRWPGAIEGYAVNCIRRFYAQLAAEHELEDLLQEAYIVFMRCKARYSSTVDNPRWFMALFQRALSNKLINLVHTTGRYISCEDIELMMNANGTHTPDIGYMRCVMEELPVEIKSLVHEVCFADDTVGRAALRKLCKLLPAL